MKIEVNGVAFEGTVEEIREAMVMMGIEFPKKDDGVVPEPERLVVGDYAVVINDEDSDFSVGEVVRIVEIDENKYGLLPYRAESVKNGEDEWMYADEIRKATEEEVADAKRATAEAERLSVGDYARLVGDSCHFRKGDVVEITETDESVVPYYAESVTSGMKGWLVEESVRKATEKDIVEAHRAAEEAERIERTKKHLEDTFAQLTSEDVRVEEITMERAPTEMFGVGGFPLYYGDNDTFTVIIRARNVR